MSILPKVIFIALCLTAPFARAETDAHAVPLDTKENWKVFYDQCAGDWDRFEARLRDAHEQVKKEIDALPQKTYLARYADEDPKINFLGAYWPADLASKDKAWTFYKDCSELNWKARQAISSLSTPKAERETKIGELKDCLIARDNLKTPEFPLNLMLSCYEKQAGR